MLTPHQLYAAAALAGFIASEGLQSQNLIDPRGFDQKENETWTMFRARFAHAQAAAMVAADPAQTEKHPIAEFSPAVLGNAIDGLESVKRDLASYLYIVKKLDAALFILREFQK